MNLVQDGLWRWSGVSSCFCKVVFDKPLPVRLLSGGPFKGSFRGSLKGSFKGFLSGFAFRVSGLL